MEKTKDFLYWAPRVLGIIFVIGAFMLSQSLSRSYDPSTLELFTYFGMLPLIGLIIGWRYELIGGIIYLIYGVGMSSMSIFLLFPFGALTILIGILFIAYHIRERRKLKNPKKVIKE